ncbi:uncharacterized protein LOC141644413 isoform X3 [Silene latifolia]|uniref:uncharacterized protein LOC141644413 isoform X3 n=1 Tax=Silene latifolia TaxID=37657 RepID=UPI003D77A5B5
MACRIVLRTVCSTQPWLFPTSSTRYVVAPFKTRPFARNPGYLVNPTRNCTTLSCSFQDDQGPPQEVILKAISVSKTEGRVGQTTNVVIGGTVTEDSPNEWLELDQKVNSYPTVRGFTAIGTGGEDFVHSMIVAVESVLQEPIPEGQVKQKVSSGGKYVSVNIGPVTVSSSQQVQAVYNAMRRDDRMKYFL